MKERIERLLTECGIAYKEVMILGSYIHIRLYGKKAAMKAATLFPKSDYSVKVFKSIVTNDWKAVAQVKG